MDSGTLIIAAVFIAIGILPFMLTGRKYRKHKRQLVKSLNLLADQQNGRITDIDVCGNFGIGMDENLGKLFFARLTNDAIVPCQVDLFAYNRCRLNTITKEFDGGEKVIDRIELVISVASSASSQVGLEFYNSETDSLTLSEELQVAEKWKQLIGNTMRRTNDLATKTHSQKKMVVGLSH